MKKFNKNSQAFLVSFMLVAILLAPVVNAQEQVTLDNQNPEDSISLTQNLLQSVAGEDKNVVVGRQVLFSAGASTIPADGTALYEWSFGDGTTEKGLDVTHIYSRAGVYRASLTISQGGNSSVDEIIVAVDKDIALLITDESVSADDIRDLQNAASTQGILLVSMHSDEDAVDYQVESTLMQLMIDGKEDLTQAKSVIIWTKRNIGLNALHAAGQEFAKIDTLDTLGFKNKNVIAITEGSLSTTARIAQNSFNVLTPQSFILVTEEAKKTIVENLDINQVLTQLQSSDQEYQVVGVHTQRSLTGLRPWNFLSFTVNFMVNNGVPINTIYLLLILPFIATIVAFARQIIGIKAFGIYAPSLVAVSFLATGLKYGLTIFVIVLAVGTIGRLLARKTGILYLPRMAIVLTLVSLSILLLFFFGALLGREGLVGISVFPIMIMVIITEKFVAVQIEQGHKVAIKLIGETLILAIVSYGIAFWESFRVLLLGYPELIFATLLLNFLIGKWMGLRLLELYRFRKVIKHVELSEKK